MERNGSELFMPNGVEVKSTALGGVEIVNSDDGEWMRLRKEFVRRMGWKVPEGSDHDRYDIDPNTRQLVYRHNSQIMAGMRITPVNAWSESLSLEMMRDNHVMHSAVADFLREIPSGVSLFDITRMVADSPQNSDEYMAINEGIPKMLGVALEFSKKIAKGGDMAWMYATTPKFYDVLTGMGIGQHLIYSGYASDEDAGKDVTYFCCTDPQQSFDALKNKSTLDRVNHGLAVSNTL